MTTLKIMAVNIVKHADSLLDYEGKLSDAIKLFVEKGGKINDVLTAVRIINKVVVTTKALREGYEAGDPILSKAYARYERIVKANRRLFPKVASATTSKRGTKGTAKKGKPVGVVGSASGLVKLNRQIIATIQKIEKPDFDAARVIAAYQVCIDQLIPKK